MSGQPPQASRASRRRRRRRRGKGAKFDAIPVAEVSGILALAKEGHGFLRDPKRDCQIQETDPYVHRELIARHGFTPDEIKQAYAKPGAIADQPRPAASSGEAQAGVGSNAEAPASKASHVRRYDGVDHPVDVKPAPERLDIPGGIRSDRN